MKKELSLAALLLTSPASPVYAQAVSELRYETMQQVQNDIKFAFQSKSVVSIERELNNVRYDVPHTITYSFIPMISGMNLDKSLQNSGKAEYEVMINYTPLDKRFDNYSLDYYYYAQASGNKVVVFDCDSSRRCRNVQDEIVVFKIDNSNVTMVKEGRGFTVIGNVKDFSLLKF